MKISFRNNFKKCSAEYSRFIIMACIALSAASCNSDFYDIEYSDSALCEKSGGTYNDEKGVCICDEEECKPKKNCVQDESRGKLVCEFSNSEESESCSENETVCRMGVLYQCKDKKLVEIKECESGVCDNNKCAECKNGDTKCSDNKIYKCYNGIWDGFEKCKLGCGINDKECRKNCLDGEQICQTNENGFGEIKICKNNIFIYKESCEHNNSCMENGEQCGNCINGDIKCDDTETGAGILKICREGEYVKNSECADGVSCIGNIKCGVCKNGHKECTIKDGRDIVRKCEDGGYVEKTCDKYCDPEKIECLSFCKENTERCIDDEDGKGMMQTCTNGEFVSSGVDNKVNVCKKDEHVVSCTDNKKCGECRNNEDNKCYYDSNRQKDVSVVCSNGRLKTISCAKDEYCSSGNAVCEKCEEGIKRCIEDENGFGIVQQCVEGKFVNVKGHKDDLESQYCRVKGSKVSCRAGRTECGECFNGKNECVNDRRSSQSDSDYLKKCVGGVYLTEKCPDNKYCNSTNTACEKFESNQDFFNSNLRCINNSSGEAVIQNCITGKCSGVQKNCLDNKLDVFGIISNKTSCSDYQNCGECLNGTGNCKIDPSSGDDILSVCNDGKIVKRKCEHKYNLYCNRNSNDCDFCNDGEKRCINDESKHGHIQECKDKVYVNVEECKGECKNNSMCK